MSTASSSSKKSKYEEDSFDEESVDEFDRRSISEIEAEISALNEPAYISPSTVIENINSEESIPEAADYEDKESIIFNNDEETSSIELGITTDTPTSFNSDDQAFKIKFIHKSTSKSAFKNRTSNRISFSFSNDRMREIDRHNRILLQRILTQKPTYENQFAKKNVSSNSRITSAALNRKNNQMQIDRENQILKRKIEAIAGRKARQQS